MWRRVRPYTGRIIVRLAPHASAAIRELVLDGQAQPDTVAEFGSALGSRGLQLRDLLQGAGVAVAPALDSAFALYVAEREREQSDSPFAPLRSLLSYFIVDARALSSLGRLRGLLTALNALEVVDFAQLEPTLRETGVPVTPDSDYVLSTTNYGVHAKGRSTDLNPSYPTYGLNAWHPSVWDKFSGAGVRFIDLEAAWNLDHADLPKAAAIQPLYGVNSVSDVGALKHGTNSLGVVLGVDNAGGVVGLAPGATFVGVVSRATVNTPDTDGPAAADITNAIVTAVQSLGTGDVLLMEVQTVAAFYSDGALLLGAPIEIVDLWFDAIRFASANGIVVIEPAGNGSSDAAWDLDVIHTSWPMGGGRTLNRLAGGVTFADSGAIMVSACSAGVDSSDVHTRLDYASHGSRIDCFAWGTNVGTTDSISPGVGNSTYTATYNGTSAASAMIAGAALLVQEMYRTVNSTAASPVATRAILADVATGTKVLGEQQVMPDLTRIAATMGAVPDVFVRDNIGDDGSVPNAFVSQSPDIIVKQAQSVNPKGDFGQGSGLEEAFVSSDDVVIGAPNYVYVRARSRNPVGPTLVSAHVYWAETMAAVPPSEWKEIGVATVAVPVPPAPAPATPGPIVVLPEITWHPVAPDAPQSHGCFVAVLDAIGDPRPPVFPSLGGNVADWARFLQIVGANNNIAFRNFNVLNPTAAVDGMEGEAAMFFAGAPFPELFDFLFTVETEPSDDAEIEWSVRLPPALARGDVEARADGSDAPRIIRAREPRRLRQVRLPGREKLRGAVRVRIAGDRMPRASLLTVRQIHREREIGRVTFAVGERFGRRKADSADGPRANG